MHQWLQCWSMDVVNLSVILMKTFGVRASGSSSLDSGSKIILSDDVVWLLGRTTFIGLCCSSMDPIGTYELVLQLCDSLASAADRWLVMLNLGTFDELSACWMGIRRCF